MTLVVGDGSVARALAAGLEAAGEPVVRWWRALGGEPPPAEVAVLAVSDGALGELGRRVRAEVLLSCAGGVPLDQAFAGVAVRGKGLLHPLRALAGAAHDARLTGTVFGIAGDDEGLSAARRLVAALGGVPLVLTATSQARYHAAAVLVSNHALGLLAAGVSLLDELGLDVALAELALTDLLGSTVENVRSLHLPRALTGPMARGDADTIAAHLAALPTDVAALYRATGRALLGVAAAKGQASAEALARIAQLLDEP